MKYFCFAFLISLLFEKHRSSPQLGLRRLIFTTQSIYFSPIRQSSRMSFDRRLRQGIG